MSSPDSPEQDPEHLCVEKVVRPPEESDLQRLRYAQSVYEAFQHLAKASKGHWKDIDPEQYVRDMRAD